MTRRNSAIDLLKYVAAIMVVAIHTHPLEQLSPMGDFFFVEIVCRLAVPFFAICTGFYLAQAVRDNSSKPVWITFRRTLILYLGWSFFYLLIHLYNWHESGMLCKAYVVGWMKSTVASSSYFHLWYLSSMLYALPLFAVAIRHIPQKWLLIIVAPLWTLQCIDYGYMMFCPEWLHPFYGSIAPFDFVFLIRMLPLLLVGAWLESITERWYSQRIMTWTFIFFACCLVGEVLWLRSIGGQRYSYLFFTLPTATTLFCLAFLFGKSMRSCNINSRALAKISMVVYCLHPAFIWLFKDVVQSSLLMFLLVALLSTTFSYGWYRMKERILKS